MSARLIIQFGTSRFLQAHAALFLHEARAQGQAAGPIVVVQTSGAADRAGRVAAFGRPEGYPVILRGMQDGVAVDRQVQVTSVARGLSAAGTTVKDMLADPAIAARLEALYAGEVLSGFAAHGMEDAARDYVATTLDRFRNPFLEHRVADIAQNHALKVERRIAAFLDWVAERDPALPMPVLRGLVARHAAREQA